MGHGISYTQLEEIVTALALQQKDIEEELGIAIPSNIQAGILTIVAYDNIDGLEETLSGGGTTHRRNGIIVQPIAKSKNKQWQSQKINTTQVKDLSHLSSRLNRLTMAM